MDLHADHSTNLSYSNRLLLISKYPMFTKKESNCSETQRRWRRLRNKQITAHVVTVTNVVVVDRQQ